MYKHSMIYKYHSWCVAVLISFRTTKRNECRHLNWYVRDWFEVYKEQIGSLGVHAHFPDTTDIDDIAGADEPADHSLAGVVQ